MSLANDFIKHQVFVDRFARTLANQYKLALKDVAKVINNALGTLELDFIRGTISRKLEEATLEMLEQIFEFALYEEEFTRRVLKRRAKIDVPAIAPNTIIEAAGTAQVATGLNNQAVSIRGAFPAFSEKKTSDYMQILSDSNVMGISEEETKATINDKSTGLFALQITGLTILGILAVSKSAREEVVKEAGIEKVQWLNDLESNICPYCKSLHREIFEVGNAPAYPAHTRCACSLVPYVQ